MQGGGCSILFFWLSHCFYWVFWWGAVPNEVFRVTSWYCWIFFRGWTSRHRECIGLRYLQSNANVPGILEFLDCPHSLIVLIVYDLLEQKSTKKSSFFQLFFIGVAYVCNLSLRPSGAYLYYNIFWRQSQPKKELFFNFFLIILVAFWKEWKYNAYNN